MVIKPELISHSLPILFLALVVMKSTAMGLPDDEEHTIMGTVVAVAWNDDLEVAAVAIRVVTERHVEKTRVTEDYLVGDTGTGRKLIELLGERVEARGNVKIDMYGDKTIFVTGFTLIEAEDSQVSEQRLPGRFETGL